MAITVNTTSGNSLTVTVSGTTQASFTTETTSVSVTPPASSAVSILQKGPKGDQGIQGIQGVPGNDGADGADGQGVPAGGSQFQVLRKVSGTDYDAEWDYADRVTLEVRFDEAVSKGDPLYITGFNNGQNRIAVAKADAADSAKMPSIGLASSDYSQNDNGQATAIGSLDDVNTQVAPNDFQEGDVLYVKAGGGLTNVKPTGTNLIQNVGKVGRRQQNNGEIVVMAIGRSNDVPNIPNGQAWIGDASGVATPTTLATVATSGSYNDLSDRPTIPTGDVVDDTTPQLGGDLDVNGNKIVSASNGDIVIDPNGTGAIILKSDDVRMEGADTSIEVGTIKLYEADVLGDNFVALKAPLSIASDLTFTLPDTDGSSGQVLKTNGSGTLSFTNALDGVSNTLTGTTSIKDAGALRGTVAFYDDAGDNYVALRGATTLTSDTLFILPTGDGAADEFLKTDGSGNLSFANPTAKFRQVHSMSFLDDIGTTYHYLPWKDINEQTTIYQEEAAMLMPYDGRIVSVSIRPATLSGSGDLTVRVYSAPTGANIFAPGSFTQEENETLAVTDTDDHHTFHFVFDNAQHFEAGDLCTIGLNASADLSSTTYWYVTTIVEFDTSADLGSSSTEHQQNP